MKRIGCGVGRWDSLLLSLDGIKNSGLKALLTLSIVAIGITSLVGSLTVTSSLRGSLDSSFGFVSIGSATFSSLYSGVESVGRAITLREGLELLESVERSGRGLQLSLSSTIGSRVLFSSSSQGKSCYGALLASDEQRLYLTNSKVVRGRNFTPLEVMRQRGVALVGSSIAEALFTIEEAVGSTISIEGMRFEVVGVLSQGGESFGGGVEGEVWLPIGAVKGRFLEQNSPFELQLLSGAGWEEIAFAEERLRAIKGLSPIEESNFKVITSDAVAESVRELLAGVSEVALIVGVITLFTALIGLANIMLIALAERSREIGLKRALGATVREIKREFLYEALIISLSGGVVGTLFSLLAGIVTASALSIPFSTPWGWIILGLTLSIVIAILSTLPPAIKIGRMEPIEALSLP